jgi:hypothetical protein
VKGKMLTRGLIFSLPLLFLASCEKPLHQRTKIAVVSASDYVSNFNHPSAMRVAREKAVDKYNNDPKLRGECRWVYGKTNNGDRTISIYCGSY